MAEEDVGASLNTSPQRPLLATTPAMGCTPSVRVWASRDVHRGRRMRAQKAELAEVYALYHRTFKSLHLSYAGRQHPPLGSPCCLQSLWGYAL